MSGIAVRRIAGPAEFQAEFGVSRETLDRLRLYEDLLKSWQKAVNLVAPSTLGEVWHRHFSDSAQLLRLAPEGAKAWVDVGSGGGFPALVLAILLAERGGASYTLVESDSRKAAFLIEVARRTGVPVEIRPERIEKFATHAKSQIFDVVTARALAPLPRLLGMVRPFFSPKTVALLLKGRESMAEVEEARLGFSFEARLEPSITDAEARIAMITKLHVRTEG